MTKALLVCRRLGVVPITVQNVSAQGIGARGPEGLQCGDKVMIRLGSLPDLPGVVKWVRQSRFGLAIQTNCSIIDLLAMGKSEFPANDEVKTFESVRQMHAQTKRPALMRVANDSGASQHWMR